MPARDRTPQSAEDPSVATVEHVLDAVASRVQPPLRPPVGRTAAQHALAICACVSADDAPTWLIYDDPEGDLAWCRVPDGTGPLDLVDVQLSAAGHADPAEVV